MGNCGGEKSGAAQRGAARAQARLSAAGMPLGPARVGSRVLRGLFNSRPCRALRRARTEGKELIYRSRCFSHASLRAGLRRHIPTRLSSVRPREMPRCGLITFWNTRLQSRRAHTAEELKQFVARSAAPARRIVKKRALMSPPDAHTEWWGHRQHSPALIARKTAR